MSTSLDRKSRMASSSDSKNSGHSPRSRLSPTYVSSSSDEKQEEPWKLENSSLWWLSHDVFQNPATILLMTSVPFCFGAYYGYAKPGNNLEEWVGGLSQQEKATTVYGDTASKPASRAAQRALEKEGEIMAARQLGLQVASRALGLATLGTVGAFGVFGAVGFYFSGYNSVSEAMHRTRHWASSQTQSFEDWLDMDGRESKTHPDVVATKGMTEEQELNYVYDTLMKEIEIGEEENTK